MLQPYEIAGASPEEVQTVGSLAFFDGMYLTRGYVES